MFMFFQSQNKQVINLIDDPKFIAFYKNWYILHANYHINQKVKALQELHSIDIYIENHNRWATVST